MKIAEAARDIGVLDHGAAGHDDLAAVGDGGVGDLLKAMDVAREARDDHAPGGVRHDGTQRLAHLGLGRREG